MINGGYDELQPQFDTQRSADGGNAFQIGRAMSETRIIVTNEMGWGGLPQ
jgi:hypothetical protein